MAMSFTLNDVAQHSSAQSCWVIIRDNVYDVTEFLPEHPGGAALILQYAGKDATSAFDAVHQPSVLTSTLPPSAHLGSLSSSASLLLSEEKSKKKKTQDELRVEKGRREIAPLSRMLNAMDMEREAKKILSYKVWAFFSSAADDEISHNENITAFTRFFFHPRVLRPISLCSASCTILGYPSSLPFFVCATGSARLGHPLGELNLARAAGHAGIIQMLSSSSSFSYQDVAEARVSEDQPLFFQLYLQRGEKAMERVREAERLGYNAIFLTVDAPVLGNRERDIRTPFVLDDEEREAERLRREAEGAVETDLPVKPGEEGDVKAAGVAGSGISSVDSDMSWEKTIPWLRSMTKLPIVIKGIQCVEDAVRAVEAGVDGILISNHGGRQLEYSMPSIEVLYRLHKQRPDVFSKCEVYMDGGVRRGTDVLKALCLGAKAVGIGRPFLYAQSAYGEPGATRLIRILETEILLGMRLLGATCVQELRPEMVERVDWQPQFRARL